MAIEIHAEIVCKFALRGLNQKENSTQFVFSRTQQACMMLGL
jgi:hypothetical protein